jgi:hypothetical protein
VEALTAAKSISMRQRGQSCDLFVKLAAEKQYSLKAYAVNQAGATSNGKSVVFG